MEHMFTPQTGEFRLTATILFVYKATPRTRATGVPRVDEHHGHPCPLGFVHDELPQLPKAPTVLLVALALANRHPAANVRQIFQHKRSLRVFGIGNKAFRDPMIGPTTKAGFRSTELLQPLFGRFCAGGLIRLSMGGTALAHLLHLLACIWLAMPANPLAKAWKSVSSSAVKAATLPRAKAQFL